MTILSQFCAIFMTKQLSAHTIKLSLITDNHLPFHIIKLKKSSYLLSSSLTIKNNDDTIIDLIGSRYHFTLLAHTHEIKK